MSSDLAECMRATTETLVKAFDGRWSLEEALAPRSAECEHIILPASLGIGKRNNDEWAEHFRGVKDLITEAKMDIDYYLAVPEERRAVCRSSLSATTAVGPYSNVYVWFLTFDDKGEKITSITEMLDGI
ncbi:hypothetical protein LTR37_012634 [Vermiconidia calcicola]|uniref:Uncharacterized protein n=1 Tax=Vermiconidia calcicola TaxID=1690605 RepID=A0ACC3MZC7_9PEZI|nr:hypothetical protein LTR37_012634 [Vermiconidia calcicola]